MSKSTLVIGINQMHLEMYHGAIGVTRKVSQRGFFFRSFLYIGLLQNQILDLVHDTFQGSHFF